MRQPARMQRLIGGLGTCAGSKPGAQPTRGHPSLDAAVPGAQEEGGSKDGDEGETGECEGMAPMGP
jgi:hypothetical protein